MAFKSELETQMERNIAKKEYIRESKFVFTVIYSLEDAIRNWVEERGVYSLQFLVFVIMFPKIRGKNETSEIIKFYRKHYLEFFIMIMAPDVSPYKKKLILKDL